MAYKAKQEASGTTLTHAQLADLYSAKVKVSSGETVSRDYVGAAVHVYTHILSDVSCRSLVLQACPAHCPTVAHLSCSRRTHTHTHTHSFRQWHFIHTSQIIAAGRGALWQEDAVGQSDEA